jgi:hypothetical protein
VTKVKVSKHIAVTLPVADRAREEEEKEGENGVREKDGSQPDDPKT